MLAVLYCGLSLKSKYKNRRVASALLRGAAETPHHDQSRPRTADEISNQHSYSCIRYPISDGCLHHSPPADYSS